MQIGGRIWFIFKTLEIILAIICIALLVVTQYLYTIIDDFTPPSATNAPEIFELPGNDVMNSDLTEEPPIEESLDIDPPQLSARLTFDLDNTYSDLEETLPRVKRNCQEAFLFRNYTLTIIRYSNKVLDLSHLLILYPSATTILISVVMEVVGQLLHDPLNKCASITLVIIRILLSGLIFTCSVLLAIKTRFETLMFMAIAAAILIILAIVDFVWKVCS